MKRFLSFFIIITIIIPMLFSLVAFFASANEIDGTLPDIDNTTNDTENPEETAKVDVSALVEKLEEINSIENIEDKYNIKTINLWIEKTQIAIDNPDISESEVTALLAEYEEIIQNVAQPIASAEDFVAMQENGSYILTENITLTEPVASFKGFLNGNGKTVTLEGTDGIFTTLDGAIIRNLTIEGEINSNDGVGALAANALGEIYVTNVINNANVFANGANKNASGFIANVTSDAEIYFDTCANNANISGGITAGFLANVEDGEVYLYFYNCVNKGAISCNENEILTSASGFVANATNGNVKVVELTYCANLGQISSTYTAGAFFACGKGNIQIYGCVNVGNVFVDYNNPTENALSIGSFVGNVEDKTYAVTIENSIQTGSLTVENTPENTPSALLVGDADGVITVRNVIISGKIISTNDNVYKITANKNAIIENTVINVQFEKRTTFDGDFLPTIDVPNNNAIDQTPNTDTSGISDEIEAEREELAYNVILSSASLDIDLKIQAFDTYFEFVTTVFENIELNRLKLSAKTAIQEAKKAITDYSADSYVLYIAEMEKILTTVNSAKTIEEFENIDIDSLIANADSLLITLKEAEATELEIAKKNAITLLSAKRENAGNVYTASSYKDYCAAFDTIVAQINEATSLKALEMLDISALKVAAEVKLIVAIPEPQEELEDDNKAVDDFLDDDKNNYDDNDVENETLAPISDTTSNNGCNSALSMSSIIVLSVIIALFSLSSVFSKNKQYKKI